MTPFASLLAPLDGSRAAARGLGCATWLATSLHAKLVVLSATPRSLPAREELMRLRVPEAYWPLVILHQAPRFPEEAILTEAIEHETALIIMSAQGEAADQAALPETAQRAPGPFALIGHVARAVIEQSAAPVLLLPPAYREALPWKHVLVPMCGETESDEALALAVTLAHALTLELHVAHVLESPARGHGLAAVTRYADAVHHEYPQQFAELVRRSLPHHTPEDCRCIMEVALSRGDVAAELLGQIAKKQVTLLVVGWHGRFTVGHAEVLKKLLAAITCPMLLVKPAPRPPFKLKVGLEID
jgi:nucleotide-binding universal stress UspA family protein